LFPFGKPPTVGFEAFDGRVALAKTGFELYASGLCGGKFAFESRLGEGGIQCLCALLSLGRRELWICTRADCVRDME